MPYTQSADYEKTVTRFLHQYVNERTKRNYQTAIYHYLQIFSVIEKNKPAQLDSAAAEYLQQISEGKPLTTDLINAANRFIKTYAPVTTHLMLHTIILWLEDCEFALNQREHKRIFSKLPPAYPTRKETELTRSMFQQIYYNLPTEWAKVLLLVLLGTGMRLGEALSLKNTDIIWKDARTEISIRAEITKTKTKRTVYLTAEASSALKTYLENREEISDRIFPFTIAAAERAMRIAADRAGYKNQTDSQRLVHWHMTRKWFISRFSLYASKETAEILAGHEGYLGRAYCRYTRQQITAQVRKAEPYISLFQTQQPQQLKIKTRRTRQSSSHSSSDKGWNVYFTLPNQYIPSDTIV